jgi:16S rRNA (cytosine967-C5)-methyltransferase
MLIMKKKINSQKSNTSLPTPRAAALKLLGLVLRGRVTIDSHFSELVAHLDPRDIAFVKHLVSTTLRQLVSIDNLLGQHVRSTPPAKVEDVLRLGAAQILFLDTPPHAAVDTSVRLLKNYRRSAYNGLVNAVLRKVVAHKNLSPDGADKNVINTPDWLFKGWQDSYGTDVAIKIAASHLQEAPIDITVKSCSPAAEWAGKLSAQLLPTGSLRLTKPGSVPELPGFKSGEWWVQDAAAALPVEILMQHLDGFEKGCKILDLCAAPGGKTMQLSAKGLPVVSVDQSPIRMLRLKENLERTSLHADLVQDDILKWQPTIGFHAILLDAPCSATGTLRRHPDLPYLKNRDDITKSSKLQLRLLEKAIEFLLPGGLLIYSVCSLEREEGPDVVSSIIDRTDLVPAAIDATALGLDASWLDENGAIRTFPFYWPEYGGLDGFYISALKKPEE